MTQKQIDKLGKLFEFFLMSKVGLKCKSILLANDVKLIFRIDGTLSSQACFSYALNEIVFQNENSLSNHFEFNEEMTHVLQYYGYYGNDMDNSIVNYEFEAKVLLDIENYSGNFPAASDIICFGMGEHSEYNSFVKEYADFTENVYFNEWRDGDNVKYNDFCQRWHNYQKKYAPNSSYSKASFNENRTPEVLIDLYKK